MIHKHLIILFAFMISTSFSFAETIFGSNGIGFLDRNEGIRSVGMAGAGLSLTDSAYFHFANPAGWYNVGKTRYTISTTLVRSYASDETGTDDLDEFLFPGMALSVPIYHNYALGLYYKPVSDYNYLLIGQSEWSPKYPIDDSDTLSYKDRLQGEGGLSKMGVNLATKFGSTSFGIASDFYLGKLDNLRIIDFDDDLFSLSGRSERRELSGFGIRLGLLSDLPGNTSIAATVSLPAKLNVSTVIQYEAGDSLKFDDLDYELPLEFGIGFSKTGNRLRGVVDAGYSFWEETADSWDSYSDYINTSRLSIGVERLPLRGALDPWYEKWLYRAGVSYDEHYIELNDNKLTIFRVAAGAGIPVKSGVGILEFAFTLDFRGDESTIGAKETVVGINVGWSSMEKWFERKQR
ncbi:MAG: hypothetical protein P9L92_19775 [Candidatus Electryonea clarkiae]|nr:hypothetical protein [Candidatus Electryonea clarkiae]MDP8287241.1 hypothetical protein [Candidatus Electryonea clarkiae]